MNTSLSLYDFINNVIIGFLLIVACFPLGYTFSDVSWTLLFICSYAIGLLYSKLNEMSIGAILRNRSTIIKESLSNSTKKYYKRKSEKICEDLYFRSYYKGWKEYCRKEIEILEAQLAFIRNLWPIIVLYFGGIVTQECDLYHSLIQYSHFTTTPVVLLASIMLIIKCLRETTNNSRSNKIGKKKEICVRLNRFLSRLCLRIILLINKCCVCPCIILLVLVLCVCIFGLPIYYETTCTIANQLLVLCILLFILLPIIGYNIQIKIYELVFEYNQYVQNECL